MSNRTTVGISITLPINLVTVLNEELDQGFGIPKGSYSALVSTLLEKWVIERRNERVNLLDKAFLPEDSKG